MDERIAGVLLAGGQGRRMGGDKALVRLEGRPLITHPMRRLAPQVASLIINANGDPARFAELGLPVVADGSRDFPGPLAGIDAALGWFARETPETQAVVSVSADAPFIPFDLVEGLRKAFTEAGGVRVAVAQSRGRRHHVIALWPMSAAPEIEAALARGDRRAESMLDALGAIPVPFPDAVIGGEAVDPFFNVNTPDDLALAGALLARAAPIERAP